MHDPSNNNCPINADPRNESCNCDCDCDCDTPQYIDLTPDYSSVQRNFLRDAAIHLEHLISQTGAHSGIYDTYRNMIVSLNIAVQSTYNVETLKHLREQLDKMQNMVLSAKPRASRQGL